MTKLYKLGSINFIKDRFIIQNDLGDLERLEIDTRKLHLTQSRGKHKRREDPNVPVLIGEDLAVWEGERDSEVLGSY